MRIENLHGCISSDEYGAKSCPFCGGKPMIQKSNRWRGRSDRAVTGYTVICVDTQCPIFSADGQYYMTIEWAVKKWNKRNTEA